MDKNKKKKVDPDGPLPKWGEPEGVKQAMDKTPGQNDVNEVKLRTDVPQNNGPKLSAAAKSKLRRIAKPTDMSDMKKTIAVGSRMEETELDEAEMVKTMKKSTSDLKREYEKLSGKKAPAGTSDQVLQLRINRLKTQKESVELQEAEKINKLTRVGWMDGTVLNVEEDDISILQNDLKRKGYSKSSSVKKGLETHMVYTAKGKPDVFLSYDGQNDVAYVSYNKRSVFESVELEEAKKMKRPSKSAIAKVMGPTKNIEQAYDAVMKKYKVDKETARTWVLDVYTDAIKGFSEEVEQVDEVSKDMKQRYLDKAVSSHYNKFVGREKATKQQLDKRRAAIQKVSKELKGKKHFSDFGEEAMIEEGIEYHAHGQVFKKKGDAIAHHAKKRGNKSDSYAVHRVDTKTNTITHGFDSQGRSKHLGFNKTKYDKLKSGQSIGEAMIDEASLKMRIAARGKIESKLRKMKNDDADMAAFLINQDDQKELAKFLKSLDAKSRKAIEAVMNEGTDFAAHRAAQAQAPTQADREKMRKVAALLAKERKVKKEEVGADKDGDGANIPREREFKGKSLLPKHKPEHAKLTPAQRYQNMMKKKMNKEEVELDEAKVMNSDKAGPGKGRPMKSLSKDEHIAAMTHHETQMNKTWNAGDKKKSQYHADMAKAHRHSTGGSSHYWREEFELDEKLDPSMGAGEYVKDFRDSDAPQFKGKSMEKKQKMAIAAYLSARRKQQDESRDRAADADMEASSAKKYRKQMSKANTHADMVAAMNRHMTAKRREKALRREETEIDENYSKKSTASLQKTHDKWKDRPMSPASANQLKAIRRELQKRGALKKEEVEQVDELSTNTLRSYNAKASDEAGELRRSTNRSPADDKKWNKRIKGQQTAVKKMIQRRKDAMYGTKKEEVEQIDELKKSTLASYIKKASDDRALASRFSGENNPGYKDARKAAAKRKKGIETAADKLAREEVEQTDEARGYKVPSNYAAMMAKKRKKAGTSEFGRHPDKKPESEVKKEESELEEAPMYSDTGWRKTSGPRKDKYGNTVKNVAKHLAKKGLSKAQSKHMDTDKDGDIDATDLKNLRNKK